MKIPLLDILRQWSSVSRQMIFIEDDGFQRRCKRLLDDEELCALMDWLAARPDAGKVIPVPADCAKCAGRPKATASAAARG